MDVPVIAGIRQNINVHVFNQKVLIAVNSMSSFQDADLLEHVLSVGYRHFLFAPRFTQVLADTLQEYAGDEDIFLTLRVSG